MKIQIYQCRFTKKLFQLDQKEEYIAHLKDLRARKKDNRKHNRKRRDFESWFKSEKEKITGIEELEEWILINFSKIVKFYNALNFHSQFRGKLEKFSLKTTHNTYASNTHSAPNGKKTNWLGSTDLPRGYPGYIGNMSGVFENHKHSGVSNIWKFIDIHTGTGSGGNNFQYSVTIWIDDWPGIAEQYVFKKLKGEIH